MVPVHIRSPDIMQQEPRWTRLVCGRCLLRQLLLQIGVHTSSCNMKLHIGCDGVTLTAPVAANGHCSKLGRLDHPYRNVNQSNIETHRRMRGCWHRW